jgi:hypothetical protein
VAAVSDVQGDVKVQSHHSGALFPIGSTRYVRAGDVLRTGAGSLTLNWVDGTRVRVGPRTSLQVLRCQLNSVTNASVSVFRLDLGQVLVRVRKLLNARSTFSVRTPTCTAGVRGTFFSVKVDAAGQTNVSVLEGQVRVERGRDQVPVDATRSALVPGSGCEAEPVKVTGLSVSARSDLDDAQYLQAPYLQVTGPQGSAATISEGTVVLKGQAEKGALVTVDGRPAISQPNGAFRVALPASPGEVMDLAVTATDEQGRSTTIRRQLTAALP